MRGCCLRVGRKFLNMANLWQRIVKQQMVEEHENDPKYLWATYAKVGWHKRDQVAEALECHEDKVQTLLKSAISSKKIERREFAVWDKLNKELVKVVGYREKGKHADRPEEVKPVKAVKKRLKPAVGMSVRSRRGQKGKIKSVSRSKCEIEWESGAITTPSFKSFSKCDIILEG
jgi:hypothetical protein